MDFLYVEAKYKDIIVLPEDFVAKLPKKVALFTTIQFSNSIPSLKKQLEDAGIEVELIRPRHTRGPGQILGCSTTGFVAESDFVYVGDGLFHPKALVLRNKKNVYTYDPKSGEQRVLDHTITATITKKLAGLYSKFLMGKNIGVLITLKPGQEKAYMTEKLQETYPDKNFYFFANHSYDFQALKDFPFVDLFLNTMCERIGYDDMDVQGVSIMNLEDLWDLRDGVFD
ncbi:MAG: diphthamide synthesis protein [Nanoarchaeota archaeon]|nr:diphthamide synthesis protein [Nanoarchaeota archaeon]